VYRSAGMDPEIRQRVLSFLQERGLRRTSQREAIIEAALDTTGDGLPDASTVGGVWGIAGVGVGDGADDLRPQLQ
jgi:hypothetical protein